MTLVMIWRSDKGISAAADTRISDGVSTITDAGPKLFQIPVAAIPFGISPPPPQQFGDVGFAFAGNTLSAQSTATMAATCLQNLSGPEPLHAPSLSDIADFVCRCAEAVVRSREFSRPGDKSRFEAAVFGYCRKQSRMAAYVLEFATNDDRLAVATTTEFDLSTQVLALGNGIGRVQELIGELVATKTLPVHPTSLIAKVIEDPSQHAVGGSLQFATANEKGVRLVPAARRVGPHEMELTVLGYSIRHLGDVGGMFPAANAHVQGSDLT
jgi:hypothetical protein